jgi:hypothetical protein
MAIKLLRIANQQSVISLDLGDRKTTWAHVSPEVKKFAQDNIQPGTEVDIISSTEADGLHVSKIGKAGTIAKTAVASPAQATGVDRPGDIGGGVKAPDAPPSQATKTNTGYRADMSPEVSRSIRRQSVMASACHAVQSVICQSSSVTADSVADYIITVFNKLILEVEK